MTINEVLNLNWVFVDDWKGLIPMHIPKCITEKDIDIFVQNIIFENVAQKLNIPYNEILPVLKKKNITFYHVKKMIFKEDKFVLEGSIRLEPLLKLLVIPDVNSVPKEISNVDKFLADFNLLNDMEKLQVLEKLGIYKVKVEIKAE